jgi:hypothetical protein
MKQKILLKKSQTSAESMIILGVFIAIFIFVLSYNNDMTFNFTSKYSSDKARISLNDISRAAQEVYSQGSGAKTRVYISLPENIHNSTVSGKTMEFVLIGQNGNYTSIARSFDFNVSGSLPNNTGNHWIYLESTGGLVNVLLS